MATATAAAVSLILSALATTHSRPAVTCSLSRAVRYKTSTASRLGGQHQVVLEHIYSHCAFIFCMWRDLVTPTYRPSNAIAVETVIRRHLTRRALPLALPVVTLSPWTTIPHSDTHTNALNWSGVDLFRAALLSDNCAAENLISKEI